MNSIGGGGGTCTVEIRLPVDPRRDGRNPGGGGRTGGASRAALRDARHASTSAGLRRSSESGEVSSLQSES
ncbi:MAG TPA: hypothetical protein VFU21_28320 [Kofleriaceae bacterium]|nr:hypothetical protein [Kofleriaceae bacterium]